MLGVMAALMAIPASAGNVVLTGHDDDFHDANGSPSAAVQLQAIVAYARNGSVLPVLTFDSGTELTTDLTALGIPFTNVDPNNAAAVTDALFNPAVFSAFIVASDSSCGGCDNTPAGEANIAAHSAAIAAFLNAGGGIVGFAGANSPNYYAFVPQTTTSVGGAPSTGYTQTAAGAAAGIPATNGDATHNLFFNPGTNGESPAFQIAELNMTTGNGTVPPPAAVTLICTGCTTTGGVLGGGGGGGGGPMPSGGSFFVRYAANLAVGDSVVDITNTGASSTTPFPTQDGNICANVYAFSPDEQLISCCSCPVTPNGLASLSARNDLISNTLTPGTPTSIVIKLLATAGPTCNAATAGIGANAFVPGMAAWGTSIHSLPVTPGSPATTFGMTETPFIMGTLSPAELTRITTLCGFIQSNGSGFGICRACRLGGLGAAHN